MKLTKYFMKRNSKKSKIRLKLSNIITVFVMILGLIIIYFIFQGKEVKAEWFNDSWTYRQRVDITNSGLVQTDFQVQITLDTAVLITNNKIQSDCDDLRITDINGKVLSYWMETGTSQCNSSTSKIWVKIPSIPTSGETIYLYYGNPSATDGDSGSETFEFFDDFENYTAETAIDGQGGWTTKRIGGSGYAKVVSINSRKHLSLSSTGTFTSVMSKNLGTKTVTSSLGYAIEAGDYATDWNEYNGHGFSTDGNTTSNGDVYNGYVMGWVGWAGALSKIRRVINGSVTDLTSVSDSAANSTYYRHTFKWVGTTLTGYRDGTSKASTTDSNHSSFSYLFFDDYSGATWNHDWIALRKAATIEPTVGSPTNEEKTPGPLAYWKFDEGYGTTAYDSTQNINNGTLGNYSSSNPEWKPESECIAGKCLYFNGTTTAGSYVDTGTVESFASATDITISAWINLKQLHSDYQAVSSDTWTKYHFGISPDSRNIWFNVKKTDANQVSSGTYTLPETDRWYHVAGVASETNGYVRLYVNGVQVKNNSTSFTIRKIAGNVIIGANGVGSSADYFNGFIDEVKIYPYARSAVQIKADYLSGIVGTGGSGASVSFGAEPQKWLSDGLVSYWKMDESSWNGTPGEVIDSSGNSNNGTSTNANTTSTSKFGNAGDFDGTDDYVNVPDSASLDVTDAITIEAWIKPASTSGRDEIIQKEGAYGLKLENGQLQGYTWGQAVVYGSTLSADEWYHVAFTYDKSQKKLYVNGELIGTPVSDSTAIATSALALSISGHGFVGGDYFNGIIDDVRIYNRTLSLKEIRDLYNWAPGPVGYWKMDEKTGTGSNVVKDTSGNGNHGTMGASMTESDWVLGKYGSALDFDGDNDYVYVGSDPILNFLDNGNFSISVWIKPRTLVSAWRRGIIIQESYLNSGYRFALSNGGAPIFWTTQSGGTLSVTGGTLLIDQWNHVEVTYNNQQAYLYLNGKKVGDAIGTYVAGSNGLNIGSYVNEYFDGSIDEVKIYSYARTAKQIVEDMNAGHPAGGSPVSSQVSYWKFDEGYGNTVNDLGFGGNNGTITGASWTNSGKFGKTLSFDGSGDKVTIPSSTGLDYQDSDQFTVSTWLNWRSITGATNNRQYIWENRSGSQAYYLMIIDNASAASPGIKAVGQGVSGEIGVTASLPNFNEWLHLAGVFDKTNGFVKIYVNGVLQDTTTGTFSSNTSSGDKLIGTYFGAGYDFDGLIDEFKVYNYALTEDEVKTDYNQGASVVLGAVSTDSSGNPDWSSERGYCIPGDTASCSAPVAEWKFDEKTGATTNDTSENNYTGTFQNSPSWTTGKYGSALDFNNSDWLSTSLDIYDIYTGGAFTVEAWSYDTAVSSYDTIASSFKSSPYDGFYLRRNTNGTAMDCCIYNSGTANCASTSAEQNVWIHWSCTYSSSVLKLYKNGDYKAQDASASMTDPANTFKIGANYGSTENWEGKIDNVKVYNYARTQAQIAWDYNRGGPVGWWKFDECQATTTYDSSGNGNNGAITIGGTGSQDGVGTCADVDSTKAWYNGVDGKYNSSLSFDGVDDEVLNNSGGFLPTGDNPRTITFWFKPDAGMSASNIAVGYGCSAGEGYNCSSAGVGKYVGAWANTGSIGVHLETCQVSGPSTPSPTTDWHFYTAVFNGNNTITFYVDAGSSTIVTPGCTINTSSGNGISIGVGKWGYYDGQIDDVRIYNYALTQEQIKNVMNQGAAIRFGPN